VVLLGVRHLLSGRLGSEAAQNSLESRAESGSREETTN
jgi:hypothetical protein